MKNFHGKQSLLPYLCMQIWVLRYGCLEADLRKSHECSGMCTSWTQFINCRSCIISLLQSCNFTSPLNRGNFVCFITGTLKISFQFDEKRRLFKCKLMQQKTTQRVLHRVAAKSCVLNTQLFHRLNMNMLIRATSQQMTIITCSSTKSSFCGWQNHLPFSCWMLSHTFPTDFL